MNLTRWRIGAILLTMLATGCASQQRLAPVVDRTAGSATALVVEAPRVSSPVNGPEVSVKRLDDSDLVATPLSAEPGAIGEPVNPAVVALLNSAGRESRSGQHDRAAASLERALQIEPQNAWLWHRLATARYEQGQYDQAEHLAAKSNAHVSSGDRLLADNWHLIARAREQAGDVPGAKAAEARAAEVSSSVN